MKTQAQFVADRAQAHRDALPTKEITWVKLQVLTDMGEPVEAPQPTTFQVSPDAFTKRQAE